ncbi:hypothetical protein DUNSADRAFT_9364 [Dunaliella salina]|uniref:Secreted protein n=1 Tax=Dunaliella salina TaxID=3046 RepID=A0ABQ7H5H1_DUNSA|nr:hypothetical protein DUNSADRAFT_9364 [Dunaliella salina]|eukprot:KAF5842104.1 hypothetical protein DUNSADRAFT_9364 [Dunaliella salina]
MCVPIRSRSCVAFIVLLCQQVLHSSVTSSQPHKRVRHPNLQHCHLYTCLGAHGGGLSGCCYPYAGFLSGALV